MSLDVQLTALRRTSVYGWSGLTHNLGPMAEEAGLYMHLWRPEELGLTKAAQLVPTLKAGLRELLDHPDRFREFNPENGWGTYEGLVEFVTEYLAACEANPDADVEVSR